MSSFGPMNAKAAFTELTRSLVHSALVLAAALVIIPLAGKRRLLAGSLALDLRHGRPGGGQCPVRDHRAAVADGNRAERACASSGRRKPPTPPPDRSASTGCRNGARLTGTRKNQPTASATS